MATKKKPKPTMIVKAGVKHGTRLSGGGKIKK